MPTYAYRCSACEHSFDIYQSFSDDALTECPECGGRLRKVFGSLGVTFSGSGFYRTDSRASSEKSQTSSSGSSTSSPSAAPSAPAAPSSAPSSSGGSGV